MILYNPDWKKRDDGWHLSNGVCRGVVSPQITRNYHWEVHFLTGSGLWDSGTAPDHISAMNEVEKRLHYKFTVEPEYQLEKGCRCLSCEEPTGKWLVTNREDTISKVFDTEEAAIAWGMEYWRDK
jgi:hypothetical protein